MYTSPLAIENCDHFIMLCFAIRKLALKQNQCKHDINSKTLIYTLLKHHYSKSNFILKIACYLFFRKLVSPLSHYRNLLRTNIPSAMSLVKKYPTDFMRKNYHLHIINLCGDFWNSILQIAYIYHLDIDRSKIKGKCIKFKYSIL